MSISTARLACSQVSTFGSGRFQFAFLCLPIFLVRCWWPNPALETTRDTPLGLSERFLGFHGHFAARLSLRPLGDIERFDFYESITNYLAGSFASYRLYLFV